MADLGKSRRSRASLSNSRQAETKALGAAIDILLGSEQKPSSGSERLDGNLEATLRALGYLGGESGTDD